MNESTTATISKFVWERYRELAGLQGDSGQHKYVKGLNKTVHKTRPGHHVTIFRFSLRQIIKSVIDDLGEKYYSKKYDQIRHHLKATGNVVYIKQVDFTPGKGGTYTYFVSDSYSDQILPNPNVGGFDAIAQRARKLTPQEAGEDREPAPVKEMSILDDFQSEPLTTIQQGVLLQLRLTGGKWVFKSKAGSRSDFGVGSDTFRRLEDRGLVSLKRRKSRQYDSIALTTKGEWVADHIGQVGYTDDVILRFLDKHGPYEVKGRLSQMSPELSELLHRSHSSIRKAINDLDEHGFVDIDWSDGGYPVKIALKGSYKDPLQPIIDRYTNKKTPKEPEQQELPVNDEVASEPEIEEPKQDHVPEQPTALTDEPRASQSEEDENPVVNRMSNIMGRMQALVMDAYKIGHNESNANNQIREVLDSFSNGEMTALKALAEIQEIVE